MYLCKFLFVYIVNVIRYKTYLITYVRKYSTNVIIIFTNYLIVQPLLSTINIKFILENNNTDLN